MQPGGDGDAARASRAGQGSTNESLLAAVQTYFEANNDTQSFVGLALLKASLEDQQLRQDEQMVRALWAVLPTKFIKRLLRTGTKSENSDANQMLDLGVSVLHTFAALLPDEARQEPKFIKRIPLLVEGLLLG
jgi:hypothetical protein